MKQYKVFPVQVILKLLHNSKKVNIQGLLAKALDVVILL